MLQLCNNLKKERIQRHLKQKDIANILKISRVAYSYYENGKRDIPIDDLITICDYYKISLDYITGRYTNN